MAFVSRTPLIKFPKRGSKAKAAKLFYGKTLTGKYSILSKTFDGKVNTDTSTRLNWGFGYAASVIGLYYTLANAEVSKLKEEIKEQNKIIGHLSNEKGKCEESAFRCWETYAVT